MFSYYYRCNSGVKYWTDLMAVNANQAAIAEQDRRFQEMLDEYIKAHKMLKPMRQFWQR